MVDTQLNKADIHWLDQDVLQKLCLHVCTFAAGDLSMQAPPNSTAHQYGHWPLIQHLSQHSIDASSQKQQCHSLGSNTMPQHPCLCLEERVKTREESTGKANLASCDCMWWKTGCLRSAGKALVCGQSTTSSSCPLACR